MRSPSTIGLRYPVKRHHYLPPLTIPFPELSLLGSCSRSIGSLAPWVLFALSGGSPQPQSYVESRLAQSNSGFLSRSLT